MSEKKDIQELIEWLKGAIPDALKHQRMSPDTRAEIESVKVQIQKNNAIDIEIASTLKHLVESIDSIKEELKNVTNNYVSRREFDLKIKGVEDKIAPMKAVLYTVGTTILLSVLGSVLALVLDNN